MTLQLKPFLFVPLMFVVMLAVVFAVSPGSASQHELAQTGGIDCPFAGCNVSSRDYPFCNIIPMQHNNCTGLVEHANQRPPCTLRYTASGPIAYCMEPQCNISTPVLIQDTCVEE